MDNLFSVALGGSGQRKVQLGVAKKIKNGARKIVLEKAEEARVAAFSAFKSLGLDVAQFSQPFMAPQKEATSSSGEESTSSFALLQHSKTILDPPLLEDRHADGEKAIDPPPAGSVKAKSGVPTQGEMLMEKPGFPDHQFNTTDYSTSITTNCISNIKGFAPHPLKYAGDIENQLKGVGDHQSKNENKQEKGPVNAVSFLGGLGSFLDLWSAKTEFFFDIHFTKKSEFNNIAPFELHGIAICWENSPVYYLNIPKDLSCHACKGNDNSIGIKDTLTPNLRVEVAKKRWDRIGAIMGRKDVKKFTWNLKIQIEVLKRAAVSVHNFCSPRGGIKSLGLDLIDNSYFMFSSVHVRNAIDMSVVSWILSPDEEKSSCPNLEKVILLLVWFCFWRIPKRDFPCFLLRRNMPVCK